MGRTPMSGGTAFRFMPAEVTDMEKALDASSGATPARSIVEGLADKFTNSIERNGQRPVQWKQVWNWFQNRRHAQKAKIDKLKSVGPGGETPPAAKVVTVAGPCTATRPSNVPMDFEAKSARDGAWYDVSAFISKRVAESGEPEVRVRFAGFGSEEDEWVNVATAVRQRSLPCETTECVAVLAGDLILCFQEANEQALYFDADILDVQRRRHDVRGCRCRFWVRYRHDQTEEVVPLRKVCRRPETEQRLQQVREAVASSRLSDKDISIEAATRPLNGTPYSTTTPQNTPTIPATPAQRTTNFNATHLPSASSNLYVSIQPGTTSPGLEPIRPIPMQSIGTPDIMSSLHQQAALPHVAPGHPVRTLHGTALVYPYSTNQEPTASTPLSTSQQPVTTFSAQPHFLSSLESSVAQQLIISAPAQQRTPPNSTVVEPSVSGAVQQQSTSSIPGSADQLAVANIGAAETSNLGIPGGVNSSNAPVSSGVDSPMEEAKNCE